MRRIIFVSAAIAALAGITGCQQCCESFRRFECWKHQAFFGTTSAACDPQIVAMPATVAAPVCAPACPPVNVCAPATTYAAPAATYAAPSACCGNGMTTIPSLPGTIAPSTTVTPGTTFTPVPGPTVQ
jgi:hypothetical protein